MAVRNAAPGILVCGISDADLEAADGQSEVQGTTYYTSTASYLCCSGCAAFDVLLSSDLLSIVSQGKQEGDSQSAQLELHYRTVRPTP
ncbi:hypothetical protein [Mesorhizobium sp. LSHC414A00]|uniref:hypothetical protein n=1 Tax=Mesorhizobium sp. LSHC414A00 TaxID=1287287 RepID=UPI0012EC8D82|nr:hypothetical protein [Mesorhizobium sp. LSHC414A00]